MRDRLKLIDSVNPETYYGFTMKEGFEYGFLGKTPVVFTGRMDDVCESIPTVYLWVPDKRDPGQWRLTWYDYDWIYERSNSYAKKILSTRLQQCIEWEEDEYVASI